MKTNRLFEAVKEARTYGFCFLGNNCFDSVTDSKKVRAFLKRNGIKDVTLWHNDDDEDVMGAGWFLVPI